MQTELRCPQPEFELALEKGLTWEVVTEDPVVVFVSYETPPTPNKVERP